MVMLIKENKKSAYLLAFSSIISIVFSAGMQLVADLNGIGKLLLASFIGKAISLGYSLLMLYFIGCIEKRIIRKNN